jgi:phage FluMu protein Com
MKENPMRCPNCEHVMEEHEFFYAPNNECPACKSTLLGSDHQSFKEPERGTIDKAQPEYKDNTGFLVPVDENLEELDKDDTDYFTL